MAEERSRFFNSTEDDKRMYNADEFAGYFSSFFVNGVIESGGLQVIAGNGMTVQVKFGHAVINGYFYELANDGGDQYLPLTLENGGSLARIDRVILRLNLDSDKRLITALTLTGTPASSPAAPALTRSGNIYDISLARISVPVGAGLISASNITDERSSYSVCGFASALGQPPYQPPGDIPAMVWQYTLFPATMTAEQQALVTGNPSLMAQVDGSQFKIFAQKSFLTNPYKNSQTFNFSGTWKCPAGVTKVDVWLVGGGGATGKATLGWGGGGGYTRLVPNITVNPNQSYPVVVGAGGAGSLGAQGGQSSAFGYAVYGGNYPRAQDGGSGGGYVGGRNGGNGSYGQPGGSSLSPSMFACGTGQGVSTMNPYTGVMYAGGGSGCVPEGGNPAANPYSGDNGGGGTGPTDANNTTTPTAGKNGYGGGGGATYTSNTFVSGGSGCVIIYY